MTDFAKELQAQAYLLVEDKISLEDFRLWYVANMGRAAPIEDAPLPFSLTPHQVYGHVSAGRNPEFSDYYQAPYEPMDRDMEAHHRKLMGGGDQ